MSTSRPKTEVIFCNISNGLPLRITQLKELLTDITGGWPKVIAGQLSGMVEDRLVTITTEAELFAWIDFYARVDWKRTGVPKKEFLAGLKHLVEQYAWATSEPHYPRLPGVYYLHAPPRAKATGLLDELVDRFSPASDVDRELVKAAFVTPATALPAGRRPAFMFTSKADGTTKDKNRGRGSGKTTLITAISLLYRGSVPIRSNSNQDRVTSDLLSTGALPIRILELDNLKSFKFSSEFFEWLITASEIGGHRMYEGFAKRPNYTTLLISANGPSLSKDVALRTVPVELKRPKYTAGWWTATRELIEGHRDEIFADVAKFLSRKPKPIKRLTRWEEWCSVVAARLSKPDDLISAIRSRAVKVDADDQAADEVIAYVASRIRAKAGYPLEIDSKRYFVTSALMNEWMDEMPGCPCGRGRATSYLKSLEDSRLQYFRSNAQRGFLWIGSASEDCPGHVTLDYVPPKKE